MHSGDARAQRGGCPVPCMYFLFGDRTSACLAASSSILGRVDCEALETVVTGSQGLLSRRWLVVFRGCEEALVLGMRGVAE